MPAEVKAIKEGMVNSAKKMESTMNMNFVFGMLFNTSKIDKK